MTTDVETLPIARKHFAADRLQEAEAACRRILADKPQHVDALDLLGAILCRQGKFKMALDSISQAIRLQPDTSQLHRNLGIVFFTAGQLDKAVHCYRRALQLSPDDAETHNNLGVALKQMGNLQEAIVGFRAALQLQPELVLAHMNLAHALQLLNQFDDSIVHYQQAIKLAPDDAVAHNGIAVVLGKQGKHADAIAYYEKALRLQPDYAEAENNLGTTLMMDHQYDQAISHYQRALQIRPDFIDALLHLGNAMKFCGDADQAIVYYEKALQQNNNHVGARSVMGSALIELGRLDKAVTHLEEALRLNPNHAPAYHNLCDLASQGKYQLTDQQIERIQTLLAGDQLDEEEASELCFALGTILDNEGKYDEAFTVYRRGNDIQQRLLQQAGHAFDAERHSEFVDDVIAVFHKQYFQKQLQGNNSQTPIFIVGMPRSGTTLTEQIIASHPDAAGAGELEDIGQLARELPSILGCNEAFPRCMTELDDTTIGDVGQRYLRRLAACDPGAKRVVDKMWNNYLYLGFILTIFPRARIIHCRRDSRDVCLSCYLCRFSSIHWAWRQQDIGHYYCEYERLMRHWRDVITVEMHEVSYDQLVREPQAVIRSLIEYCGLDWNDSCLEFHKHERAIRTASRVQVRRPIYNTSLGRWKRYESHVAPLLSVLNEANEP